MSTIDREVCIRFFLDGDRVTDQWFTLDNYTDLAELTQAFGDEWRDYELIDWSNLGLSSTAGPSLSDLWEAYELIEESPDEDIAEALLSYFNSVQHARETIENGVAEYRDREEWAAEYAEECLQLEGVALQYFDCEAFARDCEINGDVNFLDHNRGVLTWYI